MCPDIVSDGLINTQRVEWPWFAVGNVSCARFELCSWLMAYAETSIIIGDILITIIAALSELFLKSVTLID